MIVQVNSDGQMPLKADDLARLEQVIRHRLGRFKEVLTRVEVHVSDPDGPRSRGEDARCVLEVRPRGRDPLSTSSTADAAEAAAEAAARAMLKVLDREAGRLTSRRGH